MRYLTKNITEILHKNETTTVSNRLIRNTSWWAALKSYFVSNVTYYLDIRITDKHVAEYVHQWCDIHYKKHKVIDAIKGIDVLRLKFDTDREKDLQVRKLCRFINSVVVEKRRKFVYGDAGGYRRF